MVFQACSDSRRAAVSTSNQSRPSAMRGGGVEIRHVIGGKCGGWVLSLCRPENAKSSADAVISSNWDDHRRRKPTSETVGYRRLVVLNARHGPGRSSTYDLVDRARRERKHIRFQASS